MGLKEATEELKEQIKEAEKREQEAFEKEEAPKEEEKPEEPAKEEPNEEPKDAPPEEPKDVEAKKTNADFARERREKATREKKLADELAQERAELAEARRKIAELSQPKQETKTDPEPNREENPTEWLDWKDRQLDAKHADVAKKLEKVERATEAEQRQRQQDRLRKDAETELLNHEKNAKVQAEDFDDVKSYYVHQLAYSIKVLNPRISDQDLVQAINSKIMMDAKQKLDEGYENPALAIYDEVKANGYKPREKEPARDEPKPDLERVAKNRERNAGMAGSGGGAGRGEVTAKFAATEMTSAEWAKLPKAERERIIRSA